LSKKHVYSAEAEKMYIIEQLSLERIASDLNLNYKTVLYWKQEGNWEEKRLEYIKSKQMFHEELYGFARKLMHSIEEELDNGQKTDAGRLYTFTKILSMVTKVKEYEEATIKKSAADEDKTNLTPEDIKEIEELLGIKRIPKEE
jgi:hypothetical protein